MHVQGKRNFTLSPWTSPGAACDRRQTWRCTLRSMPCTGASLPLADAVLVAASHILQTRSHPRNLSWPVLTALSVVLRNYSHLSGHLPASFQQCNSHHCWTCV